MISRDPINKSATSHQTPHNNLNFESWTRTCPAFIITKKYTMTRMLRQLGLKHWTKVTVRSGRKLRQPNQPKWDLRLVFPCLLRKALFRPYTLALAISAHPNPVAPPPSSVPHPLCSYLRSSNPVPLRASSPIPQMICVRSQCSECGAYVSVKL